MSTGTAAPATPSTEGLIRLGGLPPIREYLVSAWKRREFALNMAAGDLRSQNFDTVLGNLWHLLNPLLLVAVYFLMFGIILTSVSRGTANFVGFLAVGIFVYTFLQKSATSGAGSIVNNFGLIRSLQFPRILLPTSAVIKEVLAFGSTFVVMVVVIVATELQACAGSPADVPAVCRTFTVPVTVEWLVFPALFVLMILFGLGAAFTTARITDHVRDTVNVLPYVFRIGFYISGVLYPVDRFVQEAWMKEVFNANPFYGFVTLVRHYMMPTYTGTDVGKLWLWLVVWSFGLFGFGLLYFRAREKRYGRG